MELKELTKYSMEFQAAGSFVCESSNDGRITCISERELVVLKYKPDMENELATLKFDELYVHLSDYHIADQTGIDIGVHILNVPKDQFYKLLMNEIYTPELADANPQVTKAISATWSPLGAFRKNNSALAVVTNTGNVEILIGKNFDFVCIINLSKQLVGLNKEKWDRTNKSVELNDAEKCILHERRVSECAATCVSWSPIFKTKSGRYLYVLVGHLNGYVAVWKLKCSDNIQLNTEEDEDMEDVETVLIKKFNVFEKRVTAIHWCPVSENTAWIICGDVEGYVKAILVTFSNSEFEVDEHIEVWPEQDIHTSKILSISLKTKSCFLIVKGSFILIIVIDNSTNNILATEFEDFGNMFISGVQTIGPNYFMISTYNGTMKTLEVKIKDDCQYVVEDLKTDINWQEHSARGIIKLPNGYIWGVFTYPCKFYDHLEIRKPTELILCTTATLDPGRILKENDTQHLNSCWELLDIIRCNSVKENKLPCSWLTDCKIFDEISLYELRIMYWISVASNRIIDFLPKQERHVINTPESDEMEMILSFKYRLERLKYLIGEFESKGELTQHQLYSLYMLKFSLREQQDDDAIKTYFSENFLEEANNDIDNSDKIPYVLVPACILCNIPCVDGGCTENHPFERCLVSHVQVTFESKWKCPNCEGLAHDDIEDEDPYCPFCDVPLVDYDPFVD